MIQADYGAAAVLITLGALIGKCSWTQIFILVTLEMVFYSLNIAIVKGILKAMDDGGGITVHLFGAYFGVISSFFFNGRRAVRDDERRAMFGYNSSTVAMVGTLFMFVYFPSFNSALLVGSARMRAIINTLLSISASTLVASFISNVHLGKFSF